MPARINITLKAPWWPSIFIRQRADRGPVQDIATRTQPTEVYRPFGIGKHCFFKTSSITMQIVSQIRAQLAGVKKQTCPAR